MVLSDILGSGSGDQMQLSLWSELILLFADTDSDVRDGF